MLYQVEWAVFLAGFLGELDNHFPPDKLLQFLQIHPVVFPKLTKLQPIPEATLVFTNGSSNDTFALSIQGKVMTFTTEHKSAQLL